MAALQLLSRLNGRDYQVSLNCAFSNCHWHDDLRVHFLHLINRFCEIYSMHSGTRYCKRTILASCLPTLDLYSSD